MRLSKLCQPLRFQSVQNISCRILSLFPKVLDPFWAHRLGFEARRGRYGLASLVEGPRKTRMAYPVTPSVIAIHLGIQFD
jgi:hypothetical protein